MDPIQFLLQQAGNEVSAFSSTSRYSAVKTKTIKNDKGAEIVYIKRRFIPPPEHFSVLQIHTVQEGDRLDNVTNLHLGDPEQFWRVCDANGAMHPDELTETSGSKIKITLPEGIPGQKNA